MFKRAVESGAIFQKAEYLSHVPADRIVKARIDGEADDFKYRKLILANGFNPDTGGYFYGSSYVEIVESGSRHEDALYFSLLEKTPGCCWIFPLPGGRVNIGIGSLSGSPFSMDDFRRFKDEQGISGNLICRGGGMIPLVPARKVMDGDVCRFGDAAGMVFSANGEGIRNMIKMGDLWTDCIVNGGKLNARWTANRTFIRLLASTAVVKMIAASGAFGSRIYNCLSRAAARARSFMR
jgi:flavin-dependent dehydrogenase